MGKKSGKRGHSERLGHHHRLFESRWGSRSSSSSDSSSDSDCGHKHKKAKKFSKKYFKLMRKFGHFGRHSGFGGHHFGHKSGIFNKELDPMANKAECVLCCQQIKPLVATEVLECGHIYHRLCLKGMFELAANHTNEALKLLCTQCKQEIDDNLINELRLRFNDQTISGPPVESSPLVMDLNN